MLFRRSGLSDRSDGLMPESTEYPVKHEERNGYVGSGAHPILLVLIPSFVQVRSLPNLHPNRNCRRIVAYSSLRPRILGLLPSRR